MREPNFFIIGAPKAGTSALHQYLAEHPQIFMSQPKEPHHYSTDLPGSLGMFQRDDYLRLFRAADEQQRIVGESSVYYLFSQVALPRILAEHPQAKFVVMLRNPIDLVYSLHGQHLTGLTEDVVDFATAWELQAVRAQGQQVPRTCTEPQLLQYREIGRLGTQLQRAQRLVSAEQLHVVLFDDFAASPQRVYAEVLQFLQLPDDGRTEFPRINGHATLRSRSLRQWFNHRHVPEAWRRWGRRVALDRLYARLLAWNERPTRRAPLTAEFRSHLAQAFRDEVGLLSDLVKRDLQHWLLA